MKYFIDLGEEKIHFTSQEDIHERMKNLWNNQIFKNYLIKNKGKNF
jgi:hypothetical protein